MSLGSYGAEGAFAGADLARVARQPGRPQRRRPPQRPDRRNTIWTQLREARAEVAGVGARLRGRRSVRSVTWPSDAAGSPSWDQPRILYFHHPSDPVGTFDYDAIWRRPGLDERDPTGYDVPDRPDWLPIVTWVQQVGDLVAGFSTPSGHGHNYAPTSGRLGRGGAAPGWTDADSTRLLQHLGLVLGVTPAGPRPAPPPPSPSPSSRWPAFNVTRRGLLPDGWHLGANLVMAASSASSPAGRPCRPTSSAWPDPGGGQALAWGAGAFVLVVAVLLVAAPSPPPRASSTTNGPTSVSAHALRGPDRGARSARCCWRSWRSAAAACSPCCGGSCRGGRRARAVPAVRLLAHRRRHQLGLGQRRRP